ncbi:MAG: endonuclease/exonuclease/phosphatase family protein [Pseudomonadota bacterium]
MPGPVRLATYNVEWFNALFADDGTVLNDAQPSARWQTTRSQQLVALRSVFLGLDADGVMVIEAPNTGSKRKTVTALESFARWAGLRARKAIIGFPSETEQEIAFLFDPDRLTVRHDPQGKPSGRHGSHEAPRFDSVFRYDLDADGISEQIRFSKPPLELAVTAGGAQFRLIGVHAKSKSPHGSRSPAEMNRLSIDNRRKQLAQCLWLRQRVEGHLAAGDRLIVMGDFNDGPGLDEFEKLFGHSGVEIVLGPEADAALRLCDPHATMALTRRVGIVPTTARFYLAPQKRYFEALLDFVMVSPDICATAPAWRIWHPFDDPGVTATPGLSEAILAASDHFPVTLDLTI